MRLPWAFRDDEDVMDSRYSSVMVKLIDLRTAGPPPLTSLVNMVMELIEFLQASLTIPDMECAIFAISVNTACDGILKDFGISDVALAFSVAATARHFFSEGLLWDWWHGRA